MPWRLSKLILHVGRDTERLKQCQNNHVRIDHLVKVVTQSSVQVVHEALIIDLTALLDAVHTLDTTTQLRAKLINGSIGQPRTQWVPCAVHGFNAMLLNTRVKRHNITASDVHDFH